MPPDIGKPGRRLDIGAIESGSSGQEAATMALKRPRVEADLLLVIEVQNDSCPGGDCTVADIKQAMTPPGIPTRLESERW